MDGGTGDDTLIGGTGNGDFLSGGAGNDRLSDVDGVAAASRDAGDDYMTRAFAPDWNLNDVTSLLGNAVGGGAGDDIIDLMSNHTVLKIDLNAKAGTICSSYTEPGPRSACMAAPGWTWCSIRVWVRSSFSMSKPGRKH